MNKHYQIENETDIFSIRNEVGLVAGKMGFNEFACSQIVLGLSEILYNVIRHAGQGAITFFTKSNHKVLKIKVADNGDGVEDIEQAKQEGFSTLKSSLGLGLSVAERTFDFFKIETLPGKGTTVTMEKYLPYAEAGFRYGVVCIKDDRYLVNGDEWLVKIFDGDKILLGVIDGTGQGQAAYQVSSALKNQILQNFKQPLEALIQNCDRYIRNNTLLEGATIALVKIHESDIQFLGIGDTHGCIINNKKTIPLIAQPGQLGLNLPRLIVQHFYAPDPFRIILCTDGIKNQVTEHPPDETWPVQAQANTIFNQYHRPYGDATALVSYYNKDLL